MTFNSNEKGNKKYYEEIMYISSNYYIFKKRPKTKTHSLVKVFLLYIILFLLIFIFCLFIPNLYILSVIAFIILVIYIYLLVETKYKLREFMKHNNSIITIDETGIENKEENEISSKLYWDAIEYIIINKYSICILPKNFAHFAIYIEINAKNNVYKALKKFNKLDLLIDNSI
ncbi:MAG TPA: hypothetical protein IAB49_04310 [Candidatus Caccenecus avistercoris]|nr:hypothetical protein [Candidatus Caccenecus avistercoris]